MSSFDPVSGRVLDVAAGDGDQSLTVARRVGPNGHVLSTDIAPNLVAIAARAFRGAGLTNAEARVMDAEALTVAEGSYAIVFSTPEKNPCFSIPISLIRQRAQLPPPRPGQPGPFSFGASGALEQAVANAEVEAHHVAAPLRSRREVALRTRAGEPRRTPEPRRRVSCTACLPARC